jgi:CHAT domain-containing protein
MPETADELCAVGADEIRLGERTTKGELMRLSAAGELAKYRVVHFAAQGALAGKVGNGSGPALLMTPQTTATARDDAYLTASEIAALKLNADWVVFSAFNKAAGSADGADALPGLAQAFFYAGARALLVARWSVPSGTRTQLIAGAIGRREADKRIGRAEAMRQSMLALIDQGKPLEAHPAFWAPFVVVGEGAAS